MILVCVIIAALSYPRAIGSATTGLAIRTNAALGTFSDGSSTDGGDRRSYRIRDGKLQYFSCTTATKQTKN